MNATEELARIARYALPPALAYAVGKGWIPAEMQQPLLDAALAIGAAVIAWASSVARDQKRK